MPPPPPKSDDPGSRDYQLVGLTGTVDLGIEEAELVKGDILYDMEIKRPVREISSFLNNVRGIGGASTSAQKMADSSAADSYLHDRSDCV